MPLMQQEEALQVLNPYLEKVYACITGAWTDYMKYEEWARVAHDATTRANIINGHMISRAMKAFIEEPKVKIFAPKETRTRQALFVFDRKISLRLKKLSPDLMPQNVVTGRGKSLNSQEKFPDIEAASHLVAGYTLTPLQTEIEQVYLVCPNNKKIYWELELREGKQPISTVRDMFAELAAEEYGSEFQRKDESIATERMQNGTEDQS